MRLDSGDPKPEPKFAVGQSVQIFARNVLGRRYLMGPGTIVEVVSPYGQSDEIRYKVQPHYGIESDETEVLESNLKSANT